MKTIQTTLLLAAALTLLAATAPAAGVAQVVMANERLLVHSGVCSCGGGFDFTLYFSSYYTEDVRWANEEIAPLPQPATHSYWTHLLLEDISTFVFVNYAELNLPTLDANNNDIPDFFEVSEPLAASSSGSYENDWGTVQLNFEWTRAAGSRVGSMLLTMHDSILGDIGPFTHSFELVRYTGQLAYTPGSNGITGTLTLAKDGNVSEWLSGPVAITKAATNRFNLLTLTAGNWTNASGTFSYGDSALTRDPAHPALYQGSLQDPGGGALSWKLWITDTNDVNANGIPDFSDDLAIITPPRRPVLALSLTSSNLLLRISGDAGRTNVIQQAATPSTTNWATIHTLVLTNDPQVVALPRPAASPQFWRVQVQ
jgi:hypothetical protein